MPKYLSLRLADRNHTTRREPALHVALLSTFNHLVLSRYKKAALSASPTVRTNRSAHLQFSSRQVLQYLALR